MCVENIPKNTQPSSLTQPGSDDTLDDGEEAQQAKDDRVTSSDMGFLLVSGWAESLSRIKGEKGGGVSDDGNDETYSVDHDVQMGSVSSR